MTTLADGTTGAVATRPAPRTPTPLRYRRADRVLIAIVIGAGVVPVVTAVVRNLANGWIPIGDNAYFTVRSRDVFTSHHPLLGAWSSGSLSVGEFVNNLGPMQLDLLAPFTKFGSATGTIVGVGVTQLAAIAGIAFVSHRLAGTLGLAAMMAAATTLTWTMGSQLIIEPRQHSAMVLPFLCYLVAVWALASGQAWALWIAIAAGTLPLQTHLSYALLVPVLAIPAIAGLVVAGRAARYTGGETWAAWRRAMVRHAGIGGVVALACWIQPLWDQFFGNHNFTNVLEASGSGDTPDLGTAARIAAGVVSVPPWWLRDSWAAYDTNVGIAGVASTWISLAAVAALLAGAGYLAWRRGVRHGVAGVAVAAIGLIAGIASCSRLPSGDFGLPSGNYRWLWPLGAFWLAAAAVAMLSGTTVRSRPQQLRVVTLTAIAAALAIANIPYSYQSATKENGTTRVRITRELTSQLGDAEFDGPVRIDRTNGFFGEPYTFATLVELQSLGIEFTFDEDGEIYRWGERRRADGDEPYEVSFEYGENARAPKAGARRIAFADGLQPGDSAELRSLTPRVLRDLVDDSVVRIDLAAARSETGDDFEVVEGMLDGGEPVPRFLAAEVRDLRDGGYLSGDEAAMSSIDRWAELERLRADAVAIYLTPAQP